jgi:NAD+ synthase (glutamine-hydrolysing)
MALSNKHHYLLLSTGNKSEMAVGYATLYGDMTGGLSVLSDVYKRNVYALGDTLRDVIPPRVFEKEPSAELRPGQTDTDALPPYDVLDIILQLFIEKGMDVDAIVDRTGYEPELVRGILDRVDRNEYKRRQAPPGLRVSSKAFGPGRRMPIVMDWDRTVAEEPARRHLP